MNNIEQPSQQEKSRAEKHQKLKHALAPFEDDLISQLPSPEQIIQDALLRQKKSKKFIKQLFSIALVVTVGSVIYIDPIYHRQVSMTTMGENKTVTLKDGSRIQLNTDTQLSISYHWFSRRIQLYHGEATFHVKHNTWYSLMPWLERSFNVYIDDVRIEDIGTVFNIHRLNSQDLRITVVEGAVRAYTRNKQKIDLTTGQQLSLRNGIQQSLENADIDHVIGWQKGYVYFNDQPLKVVLDELNRYGVMPVKINDSRVGEIKVSGQVDLHDRQQFIFALPSFAPISVYKQKNGVILLDKN